VDSPADAPRLTRFVVVAAVVAALGGFVFGFDTGIISGALLFMRPELGLTDGTQQAIVSSLLAGAVLGAFGGGPAADRFGRRRTILLMALLFMIGAFWAAVATSVPELIAARIVLGLAVGAASAVIPVYIAEIAPARYRGALVSLQEFMITLGILGSSVVSFLLEPTGSWRLILGTAVVHAVAFFAGMLAMPESPRWLMGHERPEQAAAVMRRACSTEEEARTELDAIRSDLTGQGARWRDLLAPAARPALLIAVAIAFFNQASGINVVIYYAPTILSAAGFADASAILASVGVGVVMVLMTGAGLLVVDRIGRRPLLLWGSLLTGLSLLGLGAAFLIPESAAARGPVLVVALLIYIAAFSPSLGLIWLILAEVFPPRLRGKGAAAGSITHWIMNFVVAATILTLISAVTETGAFWIYGVVTLGCALFVARTLPETRGRTLEQISASLAGRSRRTPSPQFPVVEE
jgi:sugar porter (SP) family MFS transporter